MLFDSVSFLKTRKKGEIDTMFNTSLSCRTLTGAREILPRLEEHEQENDIPELFSDRLTAELRSILGLFSGIKKLRAQKMLEFYSYLNPLSK